MTRLLGQQPRIEVDLDAARATRPACAGPAGASRSRSATSGASRRPGGDEPIRRDYFKVVGPRLLALVYRDGVDGTWHLERVFD